MDSQLFVDYGFQDWKDIRDLSFLRFHNIWSGSGQTVLHLCSQDILHFDDR